MLRWMFGVCMTAALAVFALTQTATAARRHSHESESGPTTPEIRVSAANSVPACVTPGALTQFLRSQNEKLDEKYSAIASDYKQHGEALRIRWDFAFYQMLLETNYLKFRHGDGTPGDVRPKQNNFAGLGATGGGVPGESFPDVSTGVMAQMQHLVAYSGEMVAHPVAHRTEENQDSIIAESKRLGRPVRFGDLTNRWAADSSYARSIIAVSERFRDSYCQGGQSVAVDEMPSGAALAHKAATEHPGAPRSALGVMVPPPVAGAVSCQVMTASYGGAVTLLVRAETSRGITMTALDVTGGNEDAEAADFIASHAPGGKVTGRFKSRGEAVQHAYQLCDSGRP